MTDQEHKERLDAVVHDIKALADELDVSKLIDSACAKLYDQLAALYTHIAQFNATVDAVKAGEQPKEIIHDYVCIQCGENFQHCEPWCGDACYMKFLNTPQS